MDNMDEREANEKLFALRNNNHNSNINNERDIIEQFVLENDNNKNNTIVHSTNNDVNDVKSISSNSSSLSIILETNKSENMEVTISQTIHISSPSPLSVLSSSNSAIPLENIETSSSGHVHQHHNHNNHNTNNKKIIFSIDDSLNECCSNVIDEDNNKNHCNSLSLFNKHLNIDKQMNREDELFNMVNSSPSLLVKECEGNITKKDEKKIRKQKRRLERRRCQHRIRTYWNAMPIDVLEKIFESLSIKERHIASQVCPHWFECFYSPSIWTTLVLTDTSFTKRKFNYYLGYQRMIDPFKTQIFLQKFGHNIRRLIIRPMSNFFNLYEFMKILSQFAQHYEPNQLRNLYRFDFTFGCRASNLSINDGFDDDQQQNRRISAGDIYGDIIGTGGKLLEALKELMFHLIGLKHLALRDLLLNTDEAQYLLDNVAINCYEQLRSLTLINCCKSQYAFLHTGIFVNLETLVISCQHLDEDVLMLLSYNRLNHLYIVQTEITRSQGPLPMKLWKKFCKVNSHTQIHLVMVNKSSYCQNLLTYELSLQPTRVTSIIYDAPIIRPVCTRLIEIGQLYSESLQCIAFYNIPKFSIRKSYVDRVDTLLIYLSQKCPRLNTIIINDLISTATLLLIVTNARNLTRLLVRRNAIRKRFDCLINPEWRENYIQWLRATSRSYDMTFLEVSRMLGYKWMPLSDEQFKQIKPDVKL